MVHAGSEASRPACTEQQTKVARLEIINGCERDPLWIANFAFQTPYFKQDLRLRAGGSPTILTSLMRAYAATRFWAKWGCDKTGSDCKIGQSGRAGRRLSS